jgi:hypothetical protein
MSKNNVTSRRTRQKRRTRSNKTTQRKAKTTKNPIAGLDLSQLKELPSSKLGGVNRKKNSKVRKHRRRVKRSVDRNAQVIMDGGTAMTINVPKQVPKPKILAFEEVDQDGSYLLGDIGDFAMVNLAKVPVKLNKMALYEVARAYANFAMSKRMPNQTISVPAIGSGEVGIFYLATAYLMLDLLSACRGEITLLQEALVQYWELRCAMTETERNEYSFFFDVEDTPNLVGIGGLFPSGIPTSAGGSSLSWPDGGTNDGYETFVDFLSVPTLTDEIIRSHGQIAVQEINAYLAGLGYELTECPTPGGEHGHYYRSIGAFAMPEPSAAISCISPTNSDPIGVFTADMQGARLGVARLETEFHHWENWLAGLGLALFDETRTPPFTRELHLGCANYADRLYNDMKGRSGTFVELKVKQQSIETITYDIMSIILAGDVLRAQDRGIDPWIEDIGPGGLREIKQWIGSALLSLSVEELVNSLVLTISAAVQEWMWVVNDMTFVKGALPIGTGTTALAGFTTQQIPLPSQIVEYLRSVNPLASVSEETCERDGVTGRMRIHYYTAIFQNAPMEYTFGLEDTVDLLLLRMLNTHFGNITSSTYTFGTGSLLPSVYLGPFGINQSYVEGPSVNDMILKVMAVTGEIQAYACLENPNAEKNGPPNTLQYYSTFIELVRDQNDLPQILDSDYQRLLNRFPITANVIGWDASHPLQGVIMDPALTGTRKLTLQLVQAYYNEPYSITYEKELTVEEYVAVISQQYVYDRASFAAENAKDDQMAVVQHLGGGFFRGLLGVGKKLIGAAPSAIRGYKSGGIPGAIMAGAASLLNHEHMMRLSPHIAKVRMGLNNMDNLCLTSGEDDSYEA